jgi:hypothetical protein
MQIGYLKNPVNANIIAGVDSDYKPNLTISDGDNIVMLHGLSTKALKKLGKVLSNIASEIILAKKGYIQ